MKTRRILAAVLTVLGFVLGIGTVWIAVQGISASPVMLKSPETAVDQAAALMDAVCSGDYECASEMLYGTPDLGTSPEDSSPAVDLLWEAYQESLKYAFTGDCYAAESGVAINVQIQCLDIASVAEGLDGRAEALLNERIETAESSTEIYDETNNYRQELVNEVLKEAVQQALEESKPVLEQTITLSLAYDHGTWWVMPDTALLYVLSGSLFE